MVLLREACGDLTGCQSSSNTAEAIMTVYARQEFGPSKFRRSLRLGAAVDPARVEAIYRNGLLLVTMPKSENARPRQIRVQVAGEGASQNTGSQTNGNASTTNR